MDDKVMYMHNDDEQKLNTSTNWSRIALSTQNFWSKECVYKTLGTSIFYSSMSLPSRFEDSLSTEGEMYLKS